MTTGWLSGSCGAADELPDTPSDRLPWRSRYFRRVEDVKLPHWQLCPKPECELVVTVRSMGSAFSTDGPVKLVRSECPAGHTFLGAYDSLFRP